MLGPREAWHGEGEVLSSGCSSALGFLELPPTSSMALRMLLASVMFTSLFTVGHEISVQVTGAQISHWLRWQPSKKRENWRLSSFLLLNLSSRTLLLNVQYRLLEIKYQNEKVVVIIPAPLFFFMIQGIWTWKISVCWMENRKGNGIVMVLFETLPKLKCWSLV